MFVRLRAHVRSNLIAYVALFFALSGTGAYASHLVVRSTDIVNGEVKSADIGARAVTPADRAGVPHARAIRNQSLALGTNTTIPMNAREFGSGTTVVGGAVRVNADGLYYVSATMNWSSNGNGGRAIQVRKNGSTTLVSDQVAAVPATFGITMQAAQGLARLADGDLLTLQGQQDSGSTLSVFVTSGSGATLSVFWIGP